VNWWRSTPRAGPSFQALQHRATTDLAIVYYAFDLLQLDGQAWTRQPLEARRQQLASVVVGSRVLLSEPLPGTAHEIERTVREHGLDWYRRQATGLHLPTGSALRRLGQGQTQSAP
jgi:ATP-dependent DNA ligase